MSVSIRRGIWWSILGGVVIAVSVYVVGGGLEPGRKYANRSCKKKRSLAIVPGCQSSAPSRGIE